MNNNPLITRDLKFLLNTKESRTIYPARKARGRNRVLAALVFIGTVWLGFNSVASIPSISKWTDRPETNSPTEPDLGKRHLTTYFHSNSTAIVQKPNPASESTQKLIDEQSVQEADKPKWKKYVVKKGDTLEKIFRRQGIDHRDAIVISKLKDAKKQLKLKPGKTLRISSHENKLQELRYEFGPEHSLAISRHGDQFEVENISRTLDIQHRVANGTIKSSLFKAGNDVGLSDQLIMQLVGIFGWDIDFALDLRKGDQFSVIFEEKLWQGEKLSDGAIIAAEFRNRGELYRAIRHVDSSGYATFYTPKGMSMRRAFLKTPMEFSRITSGFSKKRFHPILKKWRSHKGVDYGAPKGTPVLSTADGRVRFVGRKGGYGKAIILGHGGQYGTLYGHLSRYAKGLRNGKTVRQGQTIGYVGKTGLATGSHLHYEFRVNGVHRNPLTFKQPRALPIKKAYRQEFLESAKMWVAQLESMRGKPLAETNSKPKLSSGKS